MNFKLQPRHCCRSKVGIGCLKEGTISGYSLFSSMMTGDLGGPFVERVLFIIPIRLKIRLALFQLLTGHVQKCSDFFVVMEARKKFPSNLNCEWKHCY